MAACRRPCVFAFECVCVWSGIRTRRAFVVVGFSAIVVYLQKERASEKEGAGLIKSHGMEGGGERGAASRLINRANSGTNLKPVYMATCSKCRSRRRSRGIRRSSKKRRAKHQKSINEFEFTARRERVREPPHRNRNFALIYDKHIFNLAPDK